MQKKEQRSGRKEQYKNRREKTSDIREQTKTRHRQANTDVQQTSDRREYLSDRRVADKYGQLLSSGRQYQKGLDKIKQLEHALRQMISKIQRLICL